MIDFARVRYLGLCHGSESLGSWHALTRGLPAALGDGDEERRVAAALAALVGTERALLVPSTLHAAFDLFAFLARTPIALYVDEAAYPILRWGAERAIVRGAPLYGWRHHDVAALTRALALAPPGRRPIIVCDGVCGGCGRRAPLPMLVALAAAHGGLVVVDDTQGIGLCGVEGGGSLRRAALAEGAPIVVVASLAKAFGAPIGLVAGDGATLRALEAASLVRVHCSPPSEVAVRAAAHALVVNERCGDELRACLGARVGELQEVLRDAGLRPLGGRFPVQDAVAPHGCDPLRLHRRLLRAGVRTVVRRPRCRGATVVSFVVSAVHRRRDIERAAWAVRQAIGGRAPMRGCA